MKRTRIATCEAFAAALGRPVRSLRRLRHRSDWPPAVPRDPPWEQKHVDVVRQWSAALGPRPDHELRDERRLLLLARVRLLRLQNRIARGRLLPRAVVERRALEAVAKTRAALLAMPRHVAAELVGKGDAADIESILAARLAAIVDEYGNGLAGLVDSRPRL